MLKEKVMHLLATEEASKAKIIFSLEQTHPKSVFSNPLINIALNACNFLMQPGILHLKKIQWE